MPVGVLPLSHVQGQIRTLRLEPHPKAAPRSSFDESIFHDPDDLAFPRLDGLGMKSQD
jgi:hypothetical protein